MRGVAVSSDLVEFAFESRPDGELTPEDLAQLACQSWSHNVRSGLTGELRLLDDRFVQVVEGGCTEVLKTAARILADPRHHAIRILAFGPLAARRHVGWTVSGFARPPASEAISAAAQPSAANLRFLQARAAARALEVGVQAS